jgi:putative membrane protein insertion efficiency factor
MIGSASGEEPSLPPSNPLIWVLKAYQEHISPVDGGRCPSVPTCSSYSIQAFRKHGFFMGWMMTVDRLIHEGKKEASVSALVFSEGKWRLHDPVENNDFWWSPKDGNRND